MKKVNMNPKNLKTGDCVIRAISYALDKSWDEVYKDLCGLGLKMKRLPNEKKVYEKYLEQQGWSKAKQPRYTDGWNLLKYTLDGFRIQIASDFENYSDKIIVSLAKHLTVLEYNNITYEIVDTWDCGNKCVGNYWVKGA